MHALYNEIEPFAADWLERLVLAGHIPAGRVDRRSIRELLPDDVAPYQQFHAFAGIAGWPAALRLAGWPTDLPVWTGSCPCQPFSVAGQHQGFDDARHLWPEWFRLIRECRPPIVFGEQVAGGDALRWFDAVCADLEGEGYACGAADLCAAGVGAPHVRQRLYFVAIADGVSSRQGSAQSDGGTPGMRPSEGSGFGSGGHPRGVAVPQRGRRRTGRTGQAGGEASQQPDRLRAVGGVADAGRQRLDGEYSLLRADARGGGGEAAVAQTAGGGATGGVADGHYPGLEVVRVESARRELAAAERSGAAGDLGDPGGARGGGYTAAILGPQTSRGGERQGHGGDADEPVHAGADRPGFWADCEWLPCLDGQARPVEPGSFPLAHGVSGRVGRLRAYGNAIVPQVAARFVRSVMDLLA